MRRRVDKRVGLDEAIALVDEGAMVGIGGCLYSRTPWAALSELLRARRGGLTVARNLMCFEAELLLARGLAVKLISSWVGVGPTWGTPKAFRELVERDPELYEEWSHFAFGLRLQAGSMGVPFLPTKSMLGSDLMGRTSAVELDCPFTGERLCAVPALVPDVALVHVHRADERGNAQIDGPPYMDRELARAAHRVILTTERLVPTDEIAAAPDRTAIPGFLVDAVVEVPFGAYPHECHGLYEADFDHIDEYVGLVKDGGVAGVEAYLRRHVDDGRLLERMAPAIERCRERARELVPS